MRGATGSPAAAPIDGTELPSWLGRFFDLSAPYDRRVDERLSLRRLTGADASHRALSLISARVEDAIALDGSDFERATIAAYEEIAGWASRAGPATRPWRIWNFIPGILEPFAGLRHRYFSFNRARHRAVRCWLAQTTGEALPTATGTGHFGPDLHVHCLSGERTGVAVENPRQIPAYRYSRRWGPRPPCFARATRVELDGRDSLLVGGTASILGENSMHSGDLLAQVAETVANLEALVASAHDRVSLNVDPSLESFDHLRIYWPGPSDPQALHDWIDANCSRESLQLELIHGQLCRPELLIEIEGLARL